MESYKRSQILMCPVCGLKVMTRTTISLYGKAVAPTFNITAYCPNECCDGKGEAKMFLVDPELAPALQTLHAEQIPTIGHCSRLHNGRVDADAKRHHRLTLDDSPFISMAWLTDPELDLLQQAADEYSDAPCTFHIKTWSLEDPDDTPVIVTMLMAVAASKSPLDVREANACICRLVENWIHVMYDHGVTRKKTPESTKQLMSTGGSMSWLYDQDGRNLYEDQQISKRIR